MDDLPTSVSHALENGGVKRKRSPSAEGQPPAPPSKAAKTHSSHLQINYLARQYSDTLPLISVEDTLPTMLSLLGDYGGVLERHESLAGNLGARPLGPILIKRFERLFDGPPRVLKSHGKEGTTVTWLDVVEFARHKPEQFNLEKMRDGVRVCQFYTKQSRVEISEEDFCLISSGIPQKLIPPQPIADDEEKELGTLEIMEKSVSQVVQLADQVSVRARQLKHRLTARKNAIVSRREAEVTPAENARPSSSTGYTSGRDGSPTSGFVAVNSRPSKEGGPANGISLTNGKTYTAATASPATRAELMSYFKSQREQVNDPAPDPTPPTTTRNHSSKSKSKAPAVNDTIDYASILLNSASPVPIPNTPSNLVHYPRPTQAERSDDSGPYKAEMLSRMDSMQRGDRVLPPCDRCRRLHMDCLKNLTACLGCTKKHAKCSWKDVTDQELTDNPHPVPATTGGVAATGNDSNGNDNSVDAIARAVTPDGPPQPVRDEELLGEDSDEDVRASIPAPAVARHGSVAATLTTTSAPKVSTGPPAAAVSRGSTPHTPLSQHSGAGVADATSSSVTANAAVHPNGGSSSSSGGIGNAPALSPKRDTSEASTTIGDGFVDVQATARDILKKRLEMPAAGGEAGGFEAVNRPSGGSTPNSVREGSKSVEGLRAGSVGASVGGGKANIAVLIKKAGMEDEGEDEESEVGEWMTLGVEEEEKVNGMSA